MPNVVEDIKYKVQRYQELLASKEKLNEEFSSWTELFSEMSLTVRKVKLAYEMQPTDENKLELDTILRDEREYLEILNEYALKFKEINEELDRYDEASLEEQRKFLDNTHKLQVLENQIREKKKAMNVIKRESQRAAGGEKIGTNLIQVPNYRDKNVWINANYEPEFAKLVEETRTLVKARNELSNIIARQYNRQINLIEEPVVNEEVMTILPPEKPTVVYDENYYDNAPIDERIADIKEHMENLKKVRGPKKFVTFKGEKIRISEYAEKKFKFYAGELAKLEREKEKQEKVQDQTIVLAQPNYLDILASGEKGDSSVDDKSDDLNVSTIPGKKEKKNLTLENSALLSGDLILSDLTLEAGDNLNPSDKPKGFMKLLNIKKPKFVDKIKNAIKKHVVPIIIGGVVLLTMTTMLLTMKLNPAKNLEKDQNDDDLDSPVYSQSVDSNKEVMDTENNENTLLGSSFNVSEGADLYENMYDATLTRRAVNGYFAEHSERVVVGVVIQFEEQLFFFSENDINAEVNIQSMLANGGKVTAVLSKALDDPENTYEGFYKIKDVNMLNSVRGVTR